MCMFFLKKKKPNQPPLTVPQHSVPTSSLGPLPEAWELEGPAQQVSKLAVPSAALSGQRSQRFLQFDWFDIYLFVTRSFSTTFGGLFSLDLGISSSNLLQMFLYTVSYLGVMLKLLLALVLP